MNGTLQMGGGGCRSASRSRFRGVPWVLLFGMVAGAVKTRGFLRLSSGDPASLARNNVTGGSVLGLGLRQQVFERDQFVVVQRLQVDRRRAGVM